MPTAFVTGATAGIGAAFARRLASDGFDLVLLARDTERLEGTAADLRDAYAVRTETLTADLSTEKGLAAAEERVRGDDIDLLINNAGFGNGGKFLDVPVSDELAMLKVHCEAVLRLTHAVLPGMLDRGRGGVVNVSSVSAFATRGTYGASKAWVVAFSEGVAADIRARSRGRVRVMALCPGFVHTEFHDRAGMDVSDVPGFMWLDKDDVVDAALRDLRRGVLVSVPSPQYKAIVGAARFVPRGLLARISSSTGRTYR
ncbi:MAG TPA: SDR family oxidoreductase [Spirillospora sp.]